MGLRRRLQDLERATRPVNPEFKGALARRWQDLPQVVRTPGQVLGRHGVGCEGTHGVFRTATGRARRRDGRSCRGGFRPGS